MADWTTIRFNSQYHWKIIALWLVGLVAALTLTGGHSVQAQGTQNEQVQHYRAQTIALFKELLQLKREQVIAFSIFEHGPAPNFGAGNSRAYAWLQRVKRHLAQAPAGTSCMDVSRDFDLFICDSELLGFLGARYQEFHRTAVRLWVLTLCTEHPHVCGAYRK